jgi:hypothetical protein
MPVGTRPTRAHRGEQCEREVRVCVSVCVCTCVCVHVCVFLRAALIRQLGTHHMVFELRMDSSTWDLHRP